MLLYLSSEKNVDIFETQSKQLGIHTDVIVERDFTGYIEKNSSKLSHLEFLAIDLENIVDDEISLINSLSAFRLCNNNIIIIIVGIGRKHGDNFLGKFFAEGIYNFVTSKDELIREREIKNCLENTNNYINTIGYRVENFEIQKTTQKKGFLNNFLDNIKSPKPEKVYKKNKNIFKSKKEKIKDDDIIQEISKEEDNIQQNQIQVSNIIDFQEMKSISLAEKIEKSKQINNNSCQHFDNKINTIFENTFDRFKQEKRRKKMEIDTLKDDVSLFYYYQKPVGIVCNNTCIVDTLYEKNDIKSFFEMKNIELNFKDNILSEIQEFNIFERGDAL